MKIATTIAVVAFLAASWTVPLQLAQAQTNTSPATTAPKSGGPTTWDKVKGNWSVAKGKVKEKWGKLTDDDLMVIEGKRDVLVGRLQERYGYSKSDAEKRVSSWERRYKG